MNRSALPARLGRSSGLFSAALRVFVARFAGFAVVGAGALALGTVGGAALLGGCGSTSTDSPADAVDSGIIDSGIVDQASACSARHAWEHAGSGNCSLCLQLAPEVACTCTSDPADGKCSTPGQAVTNEADCTADVKTCLSKCTASDCDCEDACYAGHDACRAAEGLLGGCLVDVCTARCQ